MLKKYINVNFLEFLKSMEQDKPDVKFSAVDFDGDDENSDEEPVKEESKQQEKNQVTVLIPMTIPSCGKSRFFNALKEKVGSTRPIHVLSSDAVREQYMKEYLQKNKKSTKEEAF